MEVFGTWSRDRLWRRTFQSIDRRCRTSRGACRAVPAPPAACRARPCPPGRGPSSATRAASLDRRRPCRRPLPRPPRPPRPPPIGLEQQKNIKKQRSLASRGTIVDSQQRTASTVVGPKRPLKGVRVRNSPRDSFCIQRQSETQSIPITNPRKEWKTQ